MLIFVMFNHSSIKKKSPKHMTAVHSQKYNNNNDNNNNNLKEYHTNIIVFVSLIYTVLLCSIFDKKITDFFFLLN